MDPHAQGTEWSGSRSDPCSDHPMVLYLLCPATPMGSSVPNILCFSESTEEVVGTQVTLRASECPGQWGWDTAIPGSPVGRDVGEAVLWGQAHWVPFPWCCLLLWVPGWDRLSPSLRILAGDSRPRGIRQLSAASVQAVQDGVLTDWAFVPFQQSWEETYPIAGAPGDLGEGSHYSEFPFPHLEKGDSQVPCWVFVRTTEAGGQVLVSRSERDHPGNRREKRPSGSSRVSPTSTIFLSWWDAPGHRTTWSRTGRSRPFGPS